MSVSMPYDAQYEFDHALGLARRGETLAGLKQARAAYALARSCNDAVMVRRGLNTVAMCQASQGNFIEAIADAIDAYDLSIAAKDIGEATHAMTTLAGASGFIFDTQNSSMPLLDHCLQQAMHLSDTVLECRVRLLRGMRLGWMQRFDEAEHEYALVLSKLDDAPHNIPPAMVAINMAALSIKYAKAEGAARPELWDVSLVRTHECLDLASAESNMAVMSRGYCNLGDILQHCGDAAGAIAAFDRALQIAQQFKQLDQMVNLLIARGKLLASTGAWQAAQEAFEAAFTEAERHRPSNQTATAARELEALHRNRGDEVQALHWQDRAIEEAATFARESAHAKLQVEAFWRDWQTLAL